MGQPQNQSGLRTATFLDIVHMELFEESGPSHFNRLLQCPPCGANQKFIYIIDKGDKRPTAQVTQNLISESS